MEDIIKNQLGGQNDDREGSVNFAIALSFSCDAQATEFVLGVPRFIGSFFFFAARGGEDYWKATLGSLKL